jgi:hypothetical protein
MRAAGQTSSQECAFQASRQRQILDDLAKDYDRHLRDVLRHRELVKGSVYDLKTRCGNPSCHCARPLGGLHSATVLSWSEQGKTRLRSLAAGDQARTRDLTENYRRLRQSRLVLTKLHRAILEAMDRLEQALLVPLPPPSPRAQRRR